MRTKNYNNLNNIFLHAECGMVCSPHTRFSHEINNKMVTHSGRPVSAKYNLCAKNWNKFGRLLMTECESETVNWTFSWFSCQFYFRIWHISYKIHHSKFERLFTAGFEKKIKKTTDFILNSVFFVCVFIHMVHLVSVIQW